MNGFNASKIVETPWNTIFSPFSDILGGSFWIIPIGFIALALYIKTHNVTAVGMWLLTSCALVGSGVFVQYPAMSFVYYLIAVLGMVSAVVSIYLEGGR